MSPNLNQQRTGDHGRARFMKGRGRCLATYDQTPSAYYQARSLEVGYHFITNSQLPITEIARVSGFDSLSSFSRDMRLRYGVSPKQLRKRAFAP